MDIQSSPTSPTASGSGSTTTFTSAYRPKHRDASASASRRRRGSESVAESSTQGVLSRTTTHARSRTEDHGRHPLKEIGVSRSRSRPTFAPGLAAMDATRPGLHRMLSSDIDVSERDDKLSASNKPERGRPAFREEETTVLVHQVTPLDTLSGVALKHGVSIADLRRANKLWSSDSIHLRKVLYVPLTKSHLATIDATAPLSPTTPVAPQTPDASDPWSLSAELSSPTTTSEIRRVPASQLSFFPPPSRPARSLSSDLAEAHLDQFAPLPSHSRSTSSYASLSWSQTMPRLRPGPGTSTGTGFSPLAAFFPSNPSAPSAYNNHKDSNSNTLSSLFNAIPINLPRGPLGGRVSMDSARGSSSPGTSASDLEHEMNDVSRHNGHNHHRNGYRRSSSRTPRPPHANMPLLDSDLSSASTSGSGSEDLISFSDFIPTSATSATSKTPTIRARNKPAPYVAPTPPRSPGPAPVRTVQMTPSPAMQLPLSPMGAVGMKGGNGAVDGSSSRNQAVAATRRAIR